LTMRRAGSFSFFLPVRWSFYVLMMIPYPLSLTAGQALMTKHASPSRNTTASLSCALTPSSLTRTAEARTLTAFPNQAAQKRPRAPCERSARDDWGKAQAFHQLLHVTLGGARCFAPSCGVVGYKQRHGQGGAALLPRLLVLALAHKAISLAELLKRKVPGLHQITTGFVEDRCRCCPPPHALSVSVAHGAPSPSRW
jgi:hypothetical protein